MFNERQNNQIVILIVSSVINMEDVETKLAENFANRIFYWICSDHLNLVYVN